MSWLDWRDEADPSLVDYVANLVALRKRHAVFRRLDFFNGHVSTATGLKDVYWLTAEGQEMEGDDWGHVERRALGMQIGNDGASRERILLLFNAGEEDLPFHLPKGFPCAAFRPVFESTKPDGLCDTGAKCVGAGEAFVLSSRSFVLLQHTS